MSLSQNVSKYLAVAGVVALVGGSVFACGDDSQPTAAPDARLAKLVMVPETVAVNASQSFQLKVFGRDAAGDSLATDVASLTWKSSDARVATVSALGFVTAGDSGHATITAASGPASAAAYVTVKGSLAPPAQGEHAGWHVSPQGSATGTGSISSPWSLSYALTGATGRVQPGDTVWLHGGTYKGKIVSTVAGAAGKPVVIRQYPGERATYDAAGATPSDIRGDAFIVKGAWTEWWDFEVMSSDPNRGTDTRPNMIVNDASNTKYIDLVVHDGGIGFYNYPSAANVEVSGSIFYNNGWQRTKGGGHAMYLKSATGPVLIRDNVAFDQFGYGIHVYTDSGAGELVNLTLDGNVSFNNGSVTTDYQTTWNANILVGGEEPVKSTKVTNNMTYFAPGNGWYNLMIGYINDPNVDVTVSGNYAVGGKYVLTTGQWDRLTVSGNQLIGGDDVVDVRDPSRSGYSWSGNTYRRDPSAAGWAYSDTSYSFASWKSKTGLGQNDNVSAGLPTDTKVFVRPNPHERGRAMVVVYNWGHESSVSVDLSNVLAAGTRYEVRNVQNWFGAPVATGTFSGGTIQIPMTGVTPPTPIGGAPHLPSPTGPAFDAFIVRPVK